MKKILVIYYTQSGQLNRAVKATLKPFENNADFDVTYKEIKPLKAFPFPWSYMSFFNAFPESVHGVACELEPLNIDKKINYDLIILAYQPWFLSISIPINSFLQHNITKEILHGKNIVTIINCRNMWLGAQEKMKLALKNIGANLVGNITYVDKSSNLTSLITVLAFALKGIQDKFLGFFPKYGVSEKTLQNEAPQFGLLIKQHLEKNNFEDLQQHLINAKAINIKSNLMILEGRGRVLFPLYANYIAKKGDCNNEKRNVRVRIFGIVLPLAILILSPLITVLSRIIPLILPKKIKKEIAYYSNNSLK